MFVKERDQHNDLAFSDFFLRFKIYINIIILLPLKFQRCIAISLKSQVDPQIQKSQTVEALNVKKICQPIREGSSCWFLPQK